MLVFSESAFVEGGVGRRDGMSCMGSMTAAIVRGALLPEVKRLFVEKCIVGLQIEYVSRTKSRVYASVFGHAREDAGGDEVPPKSAGKDEVDRE